VLRFGVTTPNNWGIVDPRQALAMGPLAAEAQQPVKIWRVGFLASASASSAFARVEALWRGLRELGNAEGRNLVIEFRWAEGSNGSLPALRLTSWDQRGQLKRFLTKVAPASPTRSRRSRS
jgi:hypothetical protein